MPTLVLKQSARVLNDLFREFAITDGCEAYVKLLESFNDMPIQIMDNILLGISEFKDAEDGSFEIVDTTEEVRKNHQNILYNYWKGVYKSTGCNGSGSHWYKPVYLFERTDSKPAPLKVYDLVEYDILDINKNLAVASRLVETPAKCIAKHFGLSKLKTTQLIENNKLKVEEIPINLTLEAFDNEDTCDEMLELAQSRIDRQAEYNGGWITFEYNGEKIYGPKIPFLEWKHGIRVSEKWKTVCPKGLKMFGDNPMHTDFIVGCGFHPKDAYNDDISNILFRLFEDFNEDRKIDILNLGTRPTILGDVFIPDSGMKKPNEPYILVLPNLNIKYLDYAREAMAILTEAGGQSAHLVVELLERDIFIGRLSNIVEWCSTKQTVEIDSKLGFVYEY